MAGSDIRHSDRRDGVRIQLIGRTGQVKFKPSSSTDLIFTGKPTRRTQLLNPSPPEGTFYVYKRG